MQGFLKLLRVVNIVSTGLLAGGQLFVLLAVVPAKRRWPARDSVQLHQATLDERPDRYLLPAGWISESTSLLLLLFDSPRTRVSTGLRLIALLAGAGVGLTAFRFNRPANQQIAGWSLDAIPAEYPQIRDRWDTSHAVRTACGLVSLVGNVLASTVR